MQTGSRCGCAAAHIHFFARSFKITQHLVSWTRQDARIPSMMRVEALAHTDNANAHAGPQKRASVMIASLHVLQHI
eukprot:1712533-Pleurochrysis_carterae.AAC.2